MDVPQKEEAHQEVEAISRVAVIRKRGPIYVQTLAVSVPISREYIYRDSILLFAVLFLQNSISQMYIYIVRAVTATVRLLFDRRSHRGSGGGGGER